MILQALHHDAGEIIEQVYGNGLPIPPPMYNYQPLAYIIEIDPTTDRAQLVALPQGDRKKSERPRSDCLPYLQRSGTLPKPISLVDNAKYIFGREDGKTSASEKFVPHRKAFQELVHECYDETKVAALEPVLRFLERWQPQQPEFSIPKEVKGNDLIGFRVAGKLLHELPEIQAFWAANRRTHTEDRRHLRCLVTGGEAEVETKLPLMIKKVPGGQSSGAALSSFDGNAFTSYGLGKFSAPISRSAGEQFAKALNALLLSDRHHTLVGTYDPEAKKEVGIKYAYWSPAVIPALPLLQETPNPAEVEALGIFAEGGEMDRRKADPQITGKLLSAPRGGKEVFALSDDAPFHILGLSSHSGGRVAVRSALSLSVADLFQKQHRWFVRLRTVGPNGAPGRALGIGRLVAAAYRDRKEAPNHLIEALVQTALNDAPPPASLLPTVTRRCMIGSDILVRGEKRREHVTHARATLIKLLLTWPDEEKAKLMSDFDPTETDKAYRCGRLLYHLERIQRQALGKVNATLVDRYYGGASVTPQTVFPHLLRLANQAHLPAIRREKGAFRFQRLQDELAEIVAPLGTEFPRYFDLKAQGSFALGYYFQRAYVQREIAEAIARSAQTGKTVVETIDEELYTQDTEEEQD